MDTLYSNSNVLIKILKNNFVIEHGRCTFILNVWKWYYIEVKRVIIFYFLKLLFLLYT